MTGWPTKLDCSHPLISEFRDRDSWWGEAAPRPRFTTRALNRPWHLHLRFQTKLSPPLFRLGPQPARSRPPWQAKPYIVLSRPLGYGHVKQPYDNICKCSRSRERKHFPMVLAFGRTKYAHHVIMYDRPRWATRSFYQPSHCMYSTLAIS